MFLLWCFALNRHNYGRNLFYFHVDILNIEKNAPQAHQYLASGGFAGSFSGQKFTMIPMDQMIEMTINKSSKVVGGLSGIFDNKGGSERWMWINHFLAVLKQHLDLQIECGQLSEHPELSTIGMKKYEDQVKRVVCERRNNPFLMFVMVQSLLMKWFEMYYLLEKQERML